MYVNKRTLYYQLIRNNAFSNLRIKFIFLIYNFCRFKLFQLLFYERKNCSLHCFCTICSGKSSFGSGWKDTCACGKRNGSNQPLPGFRSGEYLTEGGNAIDATVATAFALAVTLPSAGNLGGSGFLVYHEHEGRQTAFNFREKAPLAASREMFLDENGQIKDNSSNHEGLLSVGVPGMVTGPFMAHQKMAV